MQEVEFYSGSPPRTRAQRFFDVDKHIHTSDITRGCLYQVYLNRQHPIVEYPSALTKGQVGHLALALMHHGYSVSDAIDDAKKEFLKELGGNQQTMTEAAARDFHEGKLDKYWTECLEAYERRIMPDFQGAALTGIEIPCVYEVPGSYFEDGKPASFASHLDLLHDVDGIPRLDDWKFNAASPSINYLRRDLQMALYYKVITEGWVHLDDEWIQLKAHPEIYRVQIPGLVAYKRKTTNKHGSFSKGDERPLPHVRVPFVASADQSEWIDRNLAEYAKLFRAGLFVRQPSDEGCRLCHCSQWCVPYNRDTTP